MDILSILIKVSMLFIAALIIAHSIKEHKEDGKLFYNRWLMWIGIGSLGFVALFVYTLFTSETTVGSKDFYMAVGLIIIFSIAAIASLLEYKITSGKYDRYGIKYRTPWSGTKKYSWFNIEKIEYNSTMNWYIFYGDDGKKMRFSSYLTGVESLIDYATGMGLEIVTTKKSKKKVSF